MKNIKKINKYSMLAVLTVAAAIGLIGPVASFAAGPAAVDLLSAGNFVILSETGITNTGSHASVVTGNIGSSPITAAAMNDVFCSEIAGTIYGVDAAYVGNGNQTCFAGNPPLANKTLVDNAVLDMKTAYDDAASRTLPDATELGAGNIGGMTLAPGLYKWSTDVTIPTDVTLSGGANDVWIFQIAGDLSIASGGSVPAGVKVVLTGGAQASNVFWQVGGPTGATLGTYSTFNGTILSAKQVIMQTGAVLNGRALAQTQVTLDANPVTISEPSVATTTAVKVTILKYVNGVKATPESAQNSDFPMSATWDADNIGAGSGQFVLSAAGSGGNPTPYQAITVDMSTGADYSTHEITGGDVVGASCADSKPYALLGYSSGSSLDSAENSAPTSTAPSFTDLTNNQYVIVWNETCSLDPATSSLRVHIVKYLDGSLANASSANGFQFPMSATWTAANLNGGATTTGAYVLGNNAGGAPELYGAVTVPMQAPANYTTFEVTNDIASSSPILSAETACVEGEYKLTGYQTSDESFADAANQSSTVDAPVFTGLTSDQYVIVSNITCASSTGTLIVTKNTIGGNDTFDFTGDNGLGDFSITTASSTGSETFTNLSPGTYSVIETNNSDDWTEIDNDCSAVVVAAGEVGTCTITNSKNLELGEIRGVKYEDKNGDGLLKEASYERLSGWTIYLDANDNGELDANESSTVTDNNGQYRFMNLSTGTYNVREVGQSGWIQTYPSSTSKHQIALSSGELSTKNNFGNFQLGTISGMKFNDLNGNGNKNASEPGLAGWTITLTNLDSSFSTTTATNASGTYSFSDLGPGTYQIREVQQTGWNQTTNNPSNVKMYSGTTSNGVNFGNHFGPVDSDLCITSSTFGFGIPKISPFCLGDIIRDRVNTRLEARMEELRNRISEVQDRVRQRINNLPAFDNLPGGQSGFRLGS